MNVNEYILSIKHLPLEQINKDIESICGISNFFDSKKDLEAKQPYIHRSRQEFGDWQTNERLAHDAVTLMASKCPTPQVIIEPTCGTGNFIIAALDTFNSIECIYAIEIYEPYLKILKYRILEGYLNGKYTQKISFKFYSQNVFDIDWMQVKKHIGQKRTLLIGNPPWVTNTQLSKLESNNIPNKVNYKAVRGIEAMTGKGNFDIAEYICNKLFQAFNSQNTFYGFILKNSVIKNICYSQYKLKYRFQEIEAYKINAKKEFGASVDASILIITIGSNTSLTCTNYDFYSGCKLSTFGWYNNKFVSDIETYKNIEYFDGVSTLEWRSGIKHDCQQVVELKKINGQFFNKLDEVVNIEDYCVFPYIKSSDVKGTCPTSVDKYILITQYSLSDSIEQLCSNLPKTYEYLMNHKLYFDKRKSSIYKGRSKFSMFGIGSYTFAPYKIVVSGLYKSPSFTLLLPIDNKCVIVDDTCYFLGFVQLEEAIYALKLLQMQETKSLLNAITFTDAKRVITKDLLMRINFDALSQKYQQEHTDIAQHLTYKFSKQQLSLFAV